MERVPSEPMPEKNEDIEADILRFVETPLDSYRAVFERQTPEVQEQLEEEWYWLSNEAYVGKDRHQAKRRLEEFFEHLNILEQIDKQGGLT